MEKCQRTAQENLPSNAKLRLMSNLSQVVFSTAKKRDFGRKKAKIVNTHCKWTIFKSGLQYLFISIY